MAENLEACSWLEKRSVIKFLVTKGKQSEMFRRICETKKNVLVKNSLQLGWPPWTRVE